jgi:hypothetical protein
VPAGHIPRPVIQINGDDIVTIEATTTGQFTDPGATCFDALEGDLSSNLETQFAAIRVAAGGTVTTYLDAPKLSVPGTYEVFYGCKNKLGVEANTAKKVLVVMDTTCPTCTLNTGAQTVEASFPYSDPGALCTDNLDGKKDRADVSVAGKVDVEATGKYYLTYRVEDEAGNWNDGACSGSKAYVRTVVVVDTLRPVIAVRYGGKILDVGDGTETSRSDSPVRNTAAAYFQSLLESTSASSSYRTPCILTVAGAGGFLAAMMSNRRRRIATEVVPPV